jgi:hypothetical protein
MLRFENRLSVGWRRRRSVLGRAKAYSVMLGVLWPAVSLTARANVVADWDAIAAATITPPPGAVLLPAVTEAEQRPIFQVDLASVHVAIYDAVNATDQKHEPFAIVPKSRAKGASQEAAVVGAAYGVLKGLFPGRSALYQSAYDSYVAGAAADPSKVFESKYHYRFWRPRTAIPRADEDGNPETNADPGWAPVVPTPNHPEYPAAHTCSEGSLAEALHQFYGTKKIHFILDSGVAGLLHPVHEFTSTDQMVREVADARVFGGMHYRNSTAEGARLGRRTAEWIGGRFFRRVKNEEFGH